MATLKTPLLLRWRWQNLPIPKLIFSLLWLVQFILLRCGYHIPIYIQGLAFLSLFFSILTGVIVDYVIANNYELYQKTLKEKMEEIEEDEE